MGSRTTRRRVLLLAVARLALTAGVASAKTLTLRINPDTKLGIVYRPHRNAGYAQIWSPAG